MSVLELLNNHTINDISTIIMSYYKNAYVEQDDELFKRFKNKLFKFHRNCVIECMPQIIKNNYKRHQYKMTMRIEKIIKGYESEYSIKFMLKFKNPDKNFLLTNYHFDMANGFFYRNGAEGRKYIKYTEDVLVRSDEAFIIELKLLELEDALYESDDSDSD